TILQASRRLKLSPDTVRRRLRAGSLQAHKQPTAQGFHWLIELPSISPDDLVEANQETGRLENAVEELRQSLALAREELAARRREVDRLLHLLELRSGASVDPKELPPSR